MSGWTVSPSKYEGSLRVRNKANAFEANMEIARFAASQLLYKWGAFEAIPVEGSISYQDLAVATKAEEALLSKYKAMHRPLLWPAVD